MSSSLLTIRELKTYFPILEGIVRAVDNVSLDIPQGKAVALVGESGSGKSVTALSIMRLVPPPGEIVGGEIMYKGRDILKLNEEEISSIRGKEIAMIFQNPTSFLNPVLRIGDQITEVITLHQELGKEEAEELAKETLRLVRIPSVDRIFRYFPHQLSGGMCQRVMIAMAVCCKPSILIADEPTTALDATVQNQVLRLISDVTKKFKTSLLLITHDLGIVAETADIVYVIYAGKIVESAEVYELYREPKHPYTRGLLESVLSIDEFKREMVSIGGQVPDLLRPPSGCRFHPRCQAAMKLCSQQEPRIQRFGEEHYVSCWLYGG